MLTLLVSSTGRLFDFHVLDMFELGIEKFVSLKDVKVSRGGAVRAV